MYWWSACLQDGISYYMLSFTERCLTEGHVLLEVMYYMRACLTGGHVLQEYICGMSGHVLFKRMK